MNCLENLLGQSFFPRHDTMGQKHQETSPHLVRTQAQKIIPEKLFIPQA